MTSPNAILYVALLNRISGIQLNGQPAISWIDQDLMQLESHNGDDRPPVDWPAMTIDMEDGIVTSTSPSAQKGVLKVCLRLAFNPFSSTSSITPANWRNEALYYYDLEQAVHLAIHGWTPGIVTIDDTTTPVTTADLSDIFGSFIRAALPRTEKRNDRIRVRVMYYTITIDDNSTLKGINLIPATPHGLTTNFTFPG